ncbi:unnamed protein product [Caenorhabditis brenneri]
MQHALEKKKRGGENPKVSVRLNVRPLCSNWKPVKRYECDGSQHKTKEIPSPAEEQLNARVWKTKNVRTDVIDAIALPLEGDHDQKEMVDGEMKVAGLVTRCECRKCELADRTPTVLEYSPKETRDDLYLEKKRALKEKKKTKRMNASKSSKNHRRHHQRRSRNSMSTRSFSTPPPVPPNSVISPESQQQWHKLYQEVHHTTKPIDFKKIAAVSGQIGMSELEPEDPSTPPPTENAQEHRPNRSPNLPIMKPPAITPPSNISDMIYKASPTSHQPPLVPIPPTQPQTNIVILPAPVENPLILPTITNHATGNQVTVGVSAPSGFKSDSSSSLVYMPSSPVATGAAEHALPSNSNVSIIKKMENLFYSSESNWWFLVALVMLTIFAYRSSMDQHTCYYD